MISMRTMCSPFFSMYMRTRDEKLLNIIHILSLWEDAAGITKACKYSKYLWERRIRLRNSLVLGRHYSRGLPPVFYDKNLSPPFFSTFS